MTRSEVHGKETETAEIKRNPACFLYFEKALQFLIVLLLSV